MSRAYEPPRRRVLQWVGRRVHAGGRVTAVAPLQGGITAHMDRITVDSPAGPVDVVLRRWPTEDCTEGLVAREAAALAAVRGHGVPARELLAMDEDGAETDVRCTLTSALAGQPELHPADLPAWLSQLATTQTVIHAVPHQPQTQGDAEHQDGAPSLRWIGTAGETAGWGGWSTPSCVRAARRRDGPDPWRLPALQRLVVRRSTHGCRRLAEWEEGQPGQRRRPLQTQPGGAVRRQDGG